MPGGEKRSADVIGAAMCGLTAGAWSMNGSFRNAFASLQAQSLGSQFGRLPGANDKRLLNSFLNVEDKLPVA
jgi:hypothetical protein